MTYEDWIIAVAAEAPRRSGSALKLLLHLASTSIQLGSNQLRLSDRELEIQLDICRPALTEAKRSLADIVGIESRPGVPSTFNLPASWFPGQRTLFPQPVAKFPSHQWPGNLATTGQETRPSLANFPSQSGQESWPGGQENRPPLANNSGQVASLVSHSGQENRPAPTQNQQDGDALRIESNRESVVIPLEVVTEIDRVLDTVEIPPDLWEQANTLKQAVHTFMAQRGEPATARRFPPVEMLAKCMAIAPVAELLDVLQAVSKNPKVRPGSYIWFVVVFLDHCKGIPWKTTKRRMDERKARKQPGRAEPLPFPAQLTQQLVSGVKTMR